MSTARCVHHSYEEYLRVLDVSDIKLEYFDGEIYAMAGGTLAHAELCARIISRLSHHLGRECHVFSADARVHVEATGLATYPDASVVCGEVERAGNDPHALVNPTILVEVTSRSTEDYDRGNKISHYRQIPSLTAILLVSHRARRVTLVERTPDDWRICEARAGEQLVVESPKLSLSVDTLYEGITLEA